MQKGRDSALARTARRGHSGSSCKAAPAKGEMLPRLPGTSAARAVASPAAPHGSRLPDPGISPGRERQLTRATSARRCFSECAWAAISRQNEHYPVDWQDEPEKAVASLHRRSPFDIEAGRRNAAANRGGGEHGLLPLGPGHDQQRLGRKRGAGGQTPRKRSPASRVAGRERV